MARFFKKKILFLGWFEKRLLPNLKPGSTIVMDNAPYHSRQLNKAPTMANKKAVLMEWLDKNNINYETTMRKPELYHLIKLYKPLHVTYEIDEMAKSHGFKIIRLPPYHCHFNPIELIWAMVKNSIATENTKPPFSGNHVLELLRQSVERVTPQNWANCVKHAWKEIEAAATSQEIVEERLTPFIIPLGTNNYPFLY